MLLLYHWMRTHPPIRSAVPIRRGRSIGCSARPNHPKWSIVTNPAHIDLFRAVMRHDGMTRAAEALGIGQPHVSRAIAQLEADLGFPLFVRGHGSALPTREGEAFSREVERTYAGLDQLRQAGRQMPRPKALRLSMRRRVPAYLARLQSQPIDQLPLAPHALTCAPSFASASPHTSPDLPDQ